MTASVLGVVLAGGRARRLGGVDKGLLPAGDATILDHVLRRLSPQVGGMVINANGNPERFSAWGLEVVPDSLPDRPGPLAGVLAGCEWAADHCPTVTHIATAAADTPFFPDDFVERLQHALLETRRRIAIAATTADGHEQTHPVFGLWPVARTRQLRHALEVEGLRRILDWTGREGFATAVFESSCGNPFFNVNTPEDLAECNRIAEGSG